MGTRLIAGALPLLVLALLTSVRAQGQARRQGSDVCFPGEGALTFLRPNSAFPRTVEEFSFSLFRTLAQARGERSAIVSPYSIWSVLSLAYFGALGNTAREIASTLSFTNKTHAFSNWRALRFVLESETGKAELGIANRGYFSNRLTVNSCLSSQIFDLKYVDFRRTEEARAGINKDVSDATQGRIPNLISFLSPETRLALVNAVFFKGTWDTQFDPRLNRPQEFLSLPGRSSGVVTMMSRVHDTLAGNVESLDAQMVQLPYLNSTISMFLLLPNDDQAPLSSLLSRLSSQSFRAAVSSLPSVPVPLTLSMPKFKLTTRYEEELKQALAAQGVTDLFNPARANLNGFAEARPPLTVDTAIHMATVEINEEGTVAAGATAFIDTRFGPQASQTITFNRPFVFLIVETKMRIPLFIGMVTSAADLEEL